ncbi:MAG: MoaD/ThiS family protein [Alkalispirochaetaceae bacterium]
MSSRELERSTTGTEVKVLPFGPLSELISPESTLQLSLPLPVAALRESLVARFPVLEEHTFRIAVDRRMHREETVITEAEEVALLPPFAGG